MFCSTCFMGKAHRLHSSASYTTYSQPLKLIFSDLWGPYPNPSTLGFNYYMSFADAYSKFTWLYLLKSKSKAFTVFKQFKLWLNFNMAFPLQPFKLTI